MPRKVIVIGTGICGLTAAYRLRQQGFDTVLLEREARFGGRTKADVEDGWVNNHGGCLLASTYREALALSRELGLQADEEPFGGTMQILIKGQFHKLDMHNPVASVLRAPFLSWRSKLSLLRLAPTLLRYWQRLNLHNLASLAEIDTESAEDFCLRHITREAYDLLINPLPRTMFGHDCSEMSVVELLWMLKTYAMCSAVGFRGGIETFTAALAKGQTILTQHEVQRVDETADGVRVTAQTPEGLVTLEADLCAIASDGKDLQRIHGHALTARQNHFLDQLCYNPLSLVHFKFSQRPVNDGAIVELPRSAEQPDLACFAWYHHWGTTIAPAGKGVAMVLGSSDWQFRMLELPVQERIEACRRYLYQYYPEMAQHEIGAYVTPWPRATTLGRVGNYRRLRDFVADMRADSHVVYGGDYMAQSSIGTAAATGTDLALRVQQACRTGA